MIRHYYLVSMIVLFAAFILFALRFEKRKPKARELVIPAVLAAITVASRAAFFMTPNIKPVCALVVISGACLGPVGGFMVGSLSMLVSNIMFGQGPWTPWQMMAYGLVGFIAGIIFNKVSPKRIPMCIYGGVAAIVIYGGIMNFASALMYTSKFTYKTLIATYVSGFPIDCINAVTTIIFLALAGEVLVAKIKRVINKYGLYQ